MEADGFPKAANFSDQEKDEASLPELFSGEH